MNFHPYALQNLPSHWQWWASQLVEESNAESHFTVDKYWFLRYSTWELQQKVGIAYVVS